LERSLPGTTIPAEGVPVGCGSMVRNLGVGTTRAVRGAGRATVADGSLSWGAHSARVIRADRGSAAQRKFTWSMAAYIISVTVIAMTTVCCKSWKPQPEERLPVTPVSRNRLVSATSLWVISTLHRYGGGAFVGTISRSVAEQPTIPVQHYAPHQPLHLRALDAGMSGGSAGLVTIVARL